MSQTQRAWIISRPSLLLARMVLDLHVHNDALEDISNYRAKMVGRIVCLNLTKPSMFSFIEEMD